MDHVPILTTLELPVRCITTPPVYNFWMTDWKDVNEELGARLVNTPLPVILMFKAQFQVAVQSLTETIQDVICITVLLSKASPHSKCWWNKTLLSPKKKKNKLSTLSYKSCATRDHHLHEEQTDQK